MHTDLYGFLIFEKTDFYHYHLATLFQTPSHMAVSIHGQISAWLVCGGYSQIMDNFRKSTYSSPHPLSFLGEVKGPRARISVLLQHSWQTSVFRVTKS